MAKKKVRPPTKQDTEGTPSFEQSLARLEEIVGALEEGNLGLDESIRLYEEGIRNVRVCQEKLSRAERKIEMLMGVSEAGEPHVRPFEEEAMSLEEKQTRRSRRRSLDDPDG